CAQATSNMKALLRGLIIGLILLGQSCVIEDANFIQIISCPDKFDGQEIEVTGIYHEQFEDVAIYLGRGSGTEEAMWVDLASSHDGLDGKKIKMRGRFGMNSKGHLGQYIGIVRDARIIED